MSIRAFCKKNLEFTHPTEPNVKFRVRIMDFATLPDWVVNDPLFTWAKQEGSIEVLEDKPANTKKRDSGKKNNPEPTAEPETEVETSTEGDA